MRRQTDNSARQNRNPLSLIDLGFQSAQSKSEEQTLTHFLRNLASNDPRVLELLIDHYALEIHRLVRALLDCLTESEIVDAIVQQVFIKAVVDFEQFRSEGNARVWLSGIAVNLVQTHRRKQRRRRGPTDARQAPKHEITIEQQYQAAVADLTEKQQLCVVLHYVHNLSTPYIAHVLNISDEQVHTHLTAAQHVIQQSMPDHPDASDLARILQTCWPAPVLTPSDIQRFTATVQARLQQRRLPSRFLTQFKEIGLFSAVIVAILVAFWGFWRRDTYQSEPIFPPTLVPPPTPVDVSSTTIKGVWREVEESTAGDISQMIYNAEPCVSADGSAIAFSSSASTLVDGDTNQAFDVFVVDRQTHDIERVSVNSDGVQGNGMSISPRISTDGRLLVFASLADNLVAGDRLTCMFEDDPDSSCADIFVHDRETSITERITLAYNGSEADGHSFYPTISASGRWVAYWSGADNLVTMDTELCGTKEDIHNCVDIFIYDRKPRIVDQIQTVRIPIGRSQTQQARNLISISDNGRYVAVSVHAGDLAASRVQLTNQVDVFVYDLHTGTFEPVNISSEGVPGNDASANAIMSPDGRYVAFTSKARNLVPDDTNEHADVFVRDRVAGTTERISIADDGHQGNGDSGTLAFSGLASWGEQISISDDGRHVAFTSFADDLATDLALPYNPYGWPGYNRVYLHDRQTGETDEVRFSTQESNGFYIYLHISGNGQWMSMMEQVPDCGLTDVCSTIWLYDQQTNLAVNPLENKLVITPDALASRLHQSLWHNSAVNSVAFSPDGQMVATGTSDGIVHLWRVSDGALIRPLEMHTRPVSGLAFSQEGTLLLSSARDRTVNVWRVSDGTLLDQIVERSSGIFSLAISPDDQLLALGGFGAAWVWKVDTEFFTRIDSQRYPGNYVDSVAFSPDGTILALALSDKTVWLRRTSDGEALLRLGNHTGRVLSLAFSSDGQHLATGSEDDTLNLWQIEGKADDELTARHLFTLQHPDWVKSLAFSPDGTILASASLDRSVRLWSIPDGESLGSPLDTLHQVENITFSPDGDMLAVGTIGGNLHLWQISEPELD
ncbi:MAG: hypothetical protein GY832_15220 [Chloroflexi bacterium]|nr:hypothetical protein [Chloroflexota bacterium]